MTAQPPSPPLSLPRDHPAYSFNFHGRKTTLEERMKFLDAWPDNIIPTRADCAVVGLFPYAEPRATNDYITPKLSKPVAGPLRSKDLVGKSGGGSSTRSARPQAAPAAVKAVAKEPDEEDTVSTSVKSENGLAKFLRMHPEKSLLSQTQDPAKRSQKKREAVEDWDSDDDSLSVSSESDEDAPTSEGGGTMLEEDKDAVKMNDRADKRDPDAKGRDNDGQSGSGDKDDLASTASCGTAIRNAGSCGVDLHAASAAVDTSGGSHTEHTFAGGSNRSSSPSSACSSLPAT